MRQWYRLVSAFTLLFLTTHHSKESSEGRHDDQRHCDGHGTDRPRPGGVDYRLKVNTLQMKQKFCNFEKIKMYLCIYI